MLYLTGIAGAASPIDPLECLYRQLTGPSQEKKPVIQEDMPVKEVVEIIVSRLMEAATGRESGQGQEVLVEAGLCAGGAGADKEV